MQDIQRKQPAERLLHEIHFVNRDWPIQFPLFRNLPDLAFVDRQPATQSVTQHPVQRHTR
jgi:hypothetical protein